jgi:hypothetical protein
LGSAAPSRPSPSSVQNSESKIKIIQFFLVIVSYQVLFGVRFAAAADAALQHVDGAGGQQGQNGAITTAGRMVLMTALLPPGGAFCSGLLPLTAPLLETVADSGAFEIAASAEKKTRFVLLLVR